MEVGSETFVELSNEKLFAKSLFSKQIPDSHFFCGMSKKLLLKSCGYCRTSNQKKVGTARKVYLVHLFHLTHFRTTLWRGWKTTVFKLNSKSPWKDPKKHLILVFYSKICCFKDQWWIFVEEKMMITSLAEDQDSCQFNCFPCSANLPMSFMHHHDVRGELLFTSTYACYGPPFAGESQVFQESMELKVQILASLTAETLVVLCNPFFSSFDIRFYNAVWTSFRQLSKPFGRGADKNCWNFQNPKVSRKKW